MDSNLIISIFIHLILFAVTTQYTIQPHVYPAHPGMFSAIPTPTGPPPPYQQSYTYPEPVPVPQPNPAFGYGDLAKQSY